MTRRTRALAAVVARAALMGGGITASADGHPRHHHHGWAAFHHRHHNRLAHAASVLGVTPDQLKSALKAVAAQDPQSKDAWVSALAQQLGTTPDKVKAAFSCDHSGGTT